MEKALERARILVEALPYIREFAKKTIVIKYGGHAMVEPTLRQAFAQDIVLLKAVDIHPVVVHGGGPQIDQVLERMGVQAKFVDGMRVTDSETMDVVEMVLGGKVNKDIVSLINREGGKAVGLSGKDGTLILARPYQKPIREGDPRPPELIDLGHVGEVERVNAEFLIGLCGQEIIPIIAPVGVDASGRTFNINADLVAGAVAAALHAEKLILLTDVAGVLDLQGSLISSLQMGQAGKLIADGVVRSGMIPKLDCCVDALKSEVNKAHIIDGRVPHAVILELFTDAGIGTEIYR